MKSITIVFFLISSLGLKAQETADRKSRSIYASYFGEFVTHPGIALGFSKDIRHKSKTNAKNKVKGRTFLHHHQIGAYTQFKLETSVFAMSSLGFRFTRPKDFQTTIYLGAGIHQGFLSGRTYEVDDQGNVSSKKGSNSTFLMSPSISIRKRISNNENFPMSIFWKNGLLLKYPINNSIVPQIFTELGVAYKF